MPRKRKADPLPAYIAKAIVCGLIPSDVESWKTKPVSQLTPGERVLRFAKEHLNFPEGKKIGQPLVLDAFQCAFILGVFDAPKHIAKGILSLARRNGKTLIMAVILLAFIVGPMAKQNTLVRSAAMSRDQAALIYRLMSMCLSLSPSLAGLYRCVPSTKRIVGLRKNVEYLALSRDAKVGHGQGIYILVLDECGQIDGANDDYLDMLFSSLGTYDDGRVFMISTQAPNDAAFFSVEIDACIRDQPENACCHLYAAATDDLENQENWFDANPGMRDGYRSLTDVQNLVDQAIRIPSKQNGVLNLILNRRVALQSAFLAPLIYKECGGAPDMEVFRTHSVAIALDLSARQDLTAAVIAAQDDDGVVHLKPFVFCPTDGIEARAARDRAPYAQWVKDGYMIPLGGRTMDYQQIAEYLRDVLDDMGIMVEWVIYDRWGITHFRKAANDAGFATMATWVECGQGYRDFSPRCRAFESLVLNRKIRHGMHPLLNMAFSNAIAVTDPAGNVKLDKSKSILRIDPAIAAVMAAFQVSEGNIEEEVDIAAMIG